MFTQIPPTTSAPLDHGGRKVELGGADRGGHSAPPLPMIPGSQPRFFAPRGHSGPEGWRCTFEPVGKSCGSGGVFSRHFRPLAGPLHRPEQLRGSMSSAAATVPIPGR